MSPTLTLSEQKREAFFRAVASSLESTERSGQLSKDLDRFLRSFLEILDRYKLVVWCHDSHRLEAQEEKRTWIRNGTKLVPFSDASVSQVSASVRNTGSRALTPVETTVQLRFAFEDIAYRVAQDFGRRHQDQDRDPLLSFLFSAFVTLDGMSSGFVGSVSIFDGDVDLADGVMLHDAWCDFEKRVLEKQGG